jgi:hypothetical protein
MPGPGEAAIILLILAPFVIALVVLRRRSRRLK